MASDAVLVDLPRGQVDDPYFVLVPIFFGHMELKDFSKFITIHKNELAADEHRTFNHQVDEWRDVILAARYHEGNILDLLPRACVPNT